MKLKKFIVVSLALLAPVLSIRLLAEYKDCGAYVESVCHRELPPFSGFMKFNSRYTYNVLDETTFVNQKQLYLLEDRAEEMIEDHSLYLGGSMIALVDYQHSNTDGKFPYFMRHPGSENQDGNSTQEALIHNFQMQLTGTPLHWLSVYAHILYSPQQSFGTGTITSLSRNQLQVRQGYLLLGDLCEFPFYVSLGKMFTPFGLGDTVSPFTASTAGHIFGGLSFGGLVGFSKNGFNVQAMLAQGGSQFRGMNSGDTLPTRLNNFVVSAHYDYLFNEDVDGRIGASYVHGTTFCQSFPVTHFISCEGYRNPAWDINFKLRVSRFLFLAEFASTLKVLPGSATPNPPFNEFAAHKVQALTVGLKYTDISCIPCAQTTFSAEFGRFFAGAKGSPWEGQSQMVFGLQFKFNGNVKVFSEYIHTRGYAPFHNLSGSLLGPTEADRSVRSNVVVIGMQVAI